MSIEPSAAMRRTDLDVVRSMAMILGIALHAALAYIPGAWMISDDQSSPLGLLVIGVHGFRMALFFLLSGFFTAMLWQRRGLDGLVSQRLKRIALPLAIGCVTILPLMSVVSRWAMSRQNTVVREPQPAAEPGQAVAPTDLWGAAAAGDLEVLKKFDATSKELNTPDPALGVTALGWTAIKDQPQAAAYLLSIGADPNARYSDLNTPLHTACFFGRVEVAEQLLKAGADVTLVSRAGEKPIDSLRHDRGTTQMIANLVKTPIDFKNVAAGRERIRAMLGTQPESSSVDAAAGTGEGEPGFVKRLQQKQFFQHLWFLWFLCLFNAGFVAVAFMLRALPRLRLPAVLLSMPWCLLWAVPLTALLQHRMHVGSAMPGFGPETSTGVIPLLPVLLYYAIFFAFGVMFFCIKGPQERLGRLWWLSMPLAMVALVATLVLAFMPPVSQGPLADEGTRKGLFNLMQAVYALQDRMAEAESPVVPEGK
jgi:hypothetical protein